MRTRDLGIAIGRGSPGPLNAITDVAGVRVGHATLIAGDGPLVVGQGPVRTGVTVVVPRGRPTGATGLRRLPPPQRQRRADRARMDPESGKLVDADRASPTPTASVWSATRWSPTSVARSSRGRRRLDPAGRRRDLRRPAQRHQRLPRPTRARPRRARPAAGGPVAEGNVGGGTGGLPRVQGRDRDRAAGRPATRAVTRSACWSRQIMANGSGSGSTGCRWARQIGVDEIATRRTRRAPPRDPADPAQARSSSSSRRTPRCSPISSSGSRSERPGASLVRAGPAGTQGDLFIAFSTGNCFPVDRRGRPGVARLDVRTAATNVIDALFDAPSRRPRRRSSTPWSPPRR